MRRLYNPLRLAKKYNAWMDKQHWLMQFFSMLLLVFLIRTFIFGLYWVPTCSMEPTMLVGESFFADKLTPLFSPIKHGDIISFNEPIYSYSDNWLVRLFQNYIYGPQNWTKRVIAIPGDRIQGKIEHGRPVVYLNGELLDEPYVNQFPVVAVREASYQLTLMPPFFTKKMSETVRTYDPSLSITDKAQPFYCIKPEEILPHVQSPLIFYPHTPAYRYSYFFDIFDITLGKDEYFLMGDNRQGSADSRAFGRIKRSFIPKKGETLIHGRIVLRLFSFDIQNSLIYEIFTNPFGFFKKTRSWSRWFSKVH